jgi:hypothetical protein
MLSAQHFFEAISFTGRRSHGERHELSLLLPGVFFESSKTDFLFPGLNKIVFDFIQEGDLFLNGDALLKQVISFTARKIIILTQKIILFFEG